MRQRTLRCAKVVCLVGGLLALGLTFTASSAPLEAQQARKPNFVFILTDDMRADDLRYVPRTRDLLRSKGMLFTNAFVSYGTCCPSRATIMRGQYAHNHGVWYNTNGPNGGWLGYKYHGNERDNIATRLNATGYNTGLFGKYLNQYSDRAAVPPGWDSWFATFKYRYFDYRVNDDGTNRSFGRAEGAYVTDVLSRETTKFIDASVAQGKPFFAYVSPLAPHDPSTPAPRDAHAFDGEKAPRLPSFNEGNMNDKSPGTVRELPNINTAGRAGIDNRHERRAESLRAVDDLVSRVVSKLRTTNRLNNTYIVFTSDNGWHHGEHRIRMGKNYPYEESIHVPLLIRGPGIRAGSTQNRFALNTDFFPTFTDLAGATTPAYVDGRSLRPVLMGSGEPATWRNAFLQERRPGSVRSSFRGIHTMGWKYVEYKNGARELYDLTNDPHELANLYDGTPRPYLKDRLEALKTCAGETCRKAENQQ